jgi:outer membrane protein assembly factor BamB
VVSDDGPRSTPCAESGAVYVLSSYLKLVKLDATSGRAIWQLDIPMRYGGDPVDWQNAASPLLDGGLIFLNCNNVSAAHRSFLALRQSDGSLVWRRGADRVTHATPTVATLHAVRQVIFFTQTGLVALAAATGDELWRYPFPFASSTAASPVVDGNIVYCSAGYGIGAAAVQIARTDQRFSATELWRDPRLMNEFSTPVAAQGFLYGLFGRSSQPTAPLKCIDLATGAEMWSEPGFGPGGVLLVDNKILANDERGGVVLAETYPRAYNELARFQAVTGRTWNSGAIASGRLYLRSATQGACYHLAAQAPHAPLRLMGGRMPPGGGFQLLLGTADGSPADAAQLHGVEVLATQRIAMPPDLWQSVPFLLGGETNGVLCLEDPESPILPWRFYRLRNNN